MLEAEGKLLGFRVHDFLVAGALGALKSVERKGDILLGGPRKFSRRFILKMPCKWRDDGWNHGEEAEGLSFSNRLRLEGRVLINERAITVSNWSMPAAGASDYMRVVGAMHTNMLTIFARKRFGRIIPAASGGLSVNIGRLWLVWVGVMVLAAIVKAIAPR